MKKKVFGRYFSRSKKAREALFKSLIKTFILQGRIETTLAKAKAVQGEIDKKVALAKNGSVSAVRAIGSSLSADRKLVENLVKDVASFGQRQSGFTRIIKLPPRKGDAAEMARLEWVDLPSLSERSKSKTKTETKSVKAETKKREKTAKKSVTKKKST